MSPTESPSERFSRAVAAFVAVDAEDPRRRVEGGVERPHRLVEAERVAHWVDALRPGAAESLRLAARAQHLGRWKVPRGDFPEGRVGYLSWRKALSRKHADDAAAILEQVGYEAAVVERTRELMLKRALGRDPDTQALEDALCLAFLELDFADLASKQPREKLVEILRKTWVKMSEAGRATALGLELPAPLRTLVVEAIGAGG